MNLGESKIISSHLLTTKTNEKHRDNGGNVLCTINGQLREIKAKR